MAGLQEDAIQFFAKSAVDQTRHKVVFEFEGLPLPWHIPIGVLYDLIAEEQLPWNLNVAFVSCLPQSLLPWEDDPEGDLTSLEKIFFNSLKESAYIVNRSDGTAEISRMELKERGDLWHSARTMDMDAYNETSSKLCFISTAEEQKSVPLRILLRKGRQILDVKGDVLHLSRPVAPDAVLLDSLKSFFPSIAWGSVSDSSMVRKHSVEDIEAERQDAFSERPIVSICSIEPDLQSTFGWLHKNLRSPDNFLYLGTLRAAISAKNGGKSNQAECAMDANYKAGIYNSDTKTWSIDFEVLSTFDFSLQPVFDCTEDGDILMFGTEDSFDVETKTIISKSVTLTAAVDLAAHDPQDFTTIPEAEFKAEFSCPDRKQGIFSVTDGAEVTFANILIKDCELTTDVPIGISGCPDGVDDPRVNFINVKFKGNTNEEGSPGIQTFEGSCYNINLQDIKLQNNKCENEESAVVETTGQLTIFAVNVFATSNECTAMALKGSILEMRESVFVKNQGILSGAQKQNIALGSALRFKDKATAIIVNSNFTGNQALDGGHIYIAGASSVTADNVNCTEGSSRESGGAFYVSESKLTVTNSYFASNTDNSGSGGCINLNTNSQFVGENLVFEKHDTIGNGSAIMLSESSANLKLVTCSENGPRSSNGGCLYLTKQSSVIGEHVTFRLNKGKYGGAVYMEDSSMQLTESNFTGNECSQDGGAIYQFRSTFEGTKLKFETNQAQLGSAMSVEEESAATLAECNFINNVRAVSGGAIWLSKSELTGNMLQIIGHEAMNFGGAFALSDASHVTLNSTIFEDNNCKDQGGAIDLREDSTVKMENSQFSGNVANLGGGIHCDKSLLEFTAVELSRNSAAVSGGGFFLASDCHLTGSNVTIKANGASTGAGIATADSVVSIEQSSFEDNDADTNGGVLSSSNSSVTFEEVIAVRNVASKGAVCHITGGTVDMKKCSLSSNTASSNGGAISAEKMTFTGTDLEFVLNKAESEGGALTFYQSTVTIDEFDCNENTADDNGAMNFDESTVTLTQGQFLKNSAKAGGAIAATDSTVTITTIIFRENEARRAYGGAISLNDVMLTGKDLQVEGNKAKSYGGAIYQRGENELHLTQCIFKTNEGSKGGAVYSKAKTIAFNNVTLESNQAGEGGAMYAVGSVVEMNLVKFLANKAANSGGAFMGSDAALAGTALEVMDNSAPIGPALYLNKGNQLTLKETDFLDNEGGAAVQEGGALVTIGVLDISITSVSVKRSIPDSGACFCIKNGTRLDLTDVEFSQCHAVLDGGALAVLGVDQLTISEVKVTECSAKSGGGFHISEAKTVVLSKSSFTDCVADEGDGGALLVHGAERMSVEETTVTKCTANAGGCIYLEHSEALSLENSEFSHCEARSGGGAVSAVDVQDVMIDSLTATENTARSGACLYFSGPESLQLTKSTFSVCNADADGGAMYLSGKAKVEITEITVQNNTAKSGAGFFLESAATTIQSTTFTKNVAEGGAGGAVSVVKGAAFTAREVEWKENSASFGGSLYIEGANATLTHCSFTDNVADHAGGAISFALTSKVSGDKLSFQNNRATSGGAIYFTSCSDDVSLISTEFIENSAKSDGGALTLTAHSYLFGSYLTFKTNKASFGGAIKLDLNTQLKLIQSEMTGNNASQSGGALFASFADDIDWNDVTVTSNEANALGGGLYVSDSKKATLKGVEVLKNTAKDGGGLYVASRSDVNLVRSSVNENEATNKGGAIYLADSKLSLDDAEVKKNSAVSGGGLYVFGEASVECKGATFESNKAVKDGGGASIESYDKALTCKLEGSTFDKNTAIYGGALHLVRSETQAERCKEADDELCVGIEIWNTVFSGNEAKVSGAIGYFSDAFGYRYSCEAESASTVMKTLKPLIADPAALADVICPKWTGNLVEDKDRTITEFGTYPRDIKVLVTAQDFTGPVSNQKEPIRLQTLKGLPLPGIRLSTVDAVGNVMNPVDDETFHAEILAPEGFFTRGTDVGAHAVDRDLYLSDMTTQGDPGDYELTLKYGNPIFGGEVQLLVKLEGCPMGKTMGADRKCHDCPPGQFSRGEKCVSPPQGMISYNHYLVPNPGRWHKGPCHEHTQECLSEDACLFETRFNDIAAFDDTITNCTISEEQADEYEKVQCDEGYGSPLCGSCEGKYGPLTKWRCAKCPHKAWVSLLLLAMMLWMGILAYIQIVRHQPTQSVNPELSPLNPSTSFVGGYKDPSSGADQPSGSPSQAPSTRFIRLPTFSGRASILFSDLECNRAAELIKILMNYLQTAAVFSSLNVKWMSGVKRILEIAECLGGVTTLVTSFFSDCTIAQSWSLTRPILRYLIGIFTPYIVGVCIIVIWSLTNLVSGLKFGSFSNFVLLTFSVVSYVSYLGITKLTIKMFYCISIYDSLDYSSTHKQLYLADDTSLECFQGEHWALVGIAIVVVVLFCVGYPLICFSKITLRVKRGGRSDPTVGSTLGFTYWPFKMRFYYWESIVFMRKAILATLCVFSRSMGGNQQQVFASVVLFFFLYLQVSFSPYGHEFESFNFFESSSLLLSTVTLSMGLVFGDENPMEHTRNIVTGILTLINFVFILSFLIPAFRIIRSSRRH